jgi:cytoskeletal protein RodZ
MNDDQPRDTLGTALRKARESRGLSLDQVSSATKIHSKIIHDLEMDRYDDLPAEPFTRGFIYNYVRFLGLSPPKIFEEHKGFLEEKWKKVHARSRGVTGYAFERPEGEQSRRMLWAIMIGMFVLGVLVIVIFKPTLKKKQHGHIDKLRATPTPSVILAAAPTSGNGSPLPSPSTGISAAGSTPQPVTTNEVAKPTPAASISPNPSPSSAPEQAAPDATSSTRTDQLQNGSDYEPASVKHKFVFKALADVVVQYRCDDKSLMRFTLRKDRILVLRGKEVIRLQVSNPRSLAISRGSKGYLPLYEARSTFQYNDVATFIQPYDMKEKMAEKWEGAIVLPATPDPVPEAAPEAPSAAVDAPSPALSPTP